MAAQDRFRQIRNQGRDRRYSSFPYACGDVMSVDNRAEIVKSTASKGLGCSRRCGERISGCESRNASEEGSAKQAGCLKVKPKLQHELGANHECVF
jgi:hypothetical protein